jgi:hypothetical protein
VGGRQFVQASDVADLVQRVYGSSRTLVGADRLAGGAKKGVYRLTLDDHSTAVLYVWNADENYFPASGTDEHDPLAEANDVAHFVAAHAKLTEVGVRVPRLHHLDRSRRDYPADLALVEDVRGGTLASRMDRDPDAAGPMLDELARLLAAMHSVHSAQLGKVAHVDAGTTRHERDAPTVLLDQALRQLELTVRRPTRQQDVAARVPRLAAVRDEVELLLRELYAVVVPRTGHTLIHGELGPDHVLIDEGGHPVLIDLEGLMFFDIEWEHVFLRMRFGSSYERLREPGLDEARLEFYDLVQSLSLVEGPLRIADGDFPGRDFMLRIADGHLDRIVARVRTR